MQHKYKAGEIVKAKKSINHYYEEGELITITYLAGKGRKPEYYCENGNGEEQILSEDEIMPVSPQQADKEPAPNI